MAMPVGTSNGLVYPLVLAYALIALSLWRLDAGIARSSFLPPMGDNNVDNVDATRLPHDQRLETSRFYSRQSRFEQSTGDSSNDDGIETRQDKLRRLAALALIKHVAEDGIRKGGVVEPRTPK